MRIKTEGRIEETLDDILRRSGLRTKEDLTQEEELEYERQFRKMLLDLGDQGYDIVPEIWVEYANLGQSIYQAW